MSKKIIDFNRKIKEKKEVINIKDKGTCKEIIKFFAIDENKNLTKDEIIFLSAHCKFKEDNFSAEVGTSYFFDIRINTLFDPIDHYESYSKEYSPFIQSFSNLMRLARKNDNATMVSFFFPVSEDSYCPITDSFLI